jgi:hypothetical protein
MASYDRPPIPVVGKEQREQTKIAQEQINAYSRRFFDATRAVERMNTALDTDGLHFIGRNDVRIPCKNFFEELDTIIAFNPQGHLSPWLLDVLRKPRFFDDVGDSVEDWSDIASAVSRIPIQPDEVSTLSTESNKEKSLHRLRRVGQYTVETAIPVVIEAHAQWQAQNDGRAFNDAWLLEHFSGLESFARKRYGGMSLLILCTPEEVQRDFKERGDTLKSAKEKLTAAHAQWKKSGSTQPLNVVWLYENGFGPIYQWCNDHMAEGFRGMIDMLSDEVKKDFFLRELAQELTLTTATAALEQAYHLWVSLSVQERGTFSGWLGKTKEQKVLFNWLRRYQRRDADVFRTQILGNVSADVLAALNKSVFLK